MTFGNHITVAEFHYLRKAVGWKELDDERAQNSIENALFLVTALIDGKIAGLTRVGGDGGYTIFITDVIVLPEYQKKGIGKKLMAKAMDFIRESYVKKGQSVIVYLMSNKGLEHFYKQFGFEERPNEKFGAGMTQWVENLHD